MYGPEKCCFCFLRSRPFHVALVLNTMYNLAWWVVFLQNSGILEYLLSHVMAALMGCLRAKLSFPFLQLCLVGMCAGCLSGHGLGKTRMPDPCMCDGRTWQLLQQQLEVSRVSCLLPLQWQVQCGDEKSCKSSLSLSCPVDRDKKQHTSALLLSAVTSHIGICVK